MPPAARLLCLAVLGAVALGADTGGFAYVTFFYGGDTSAASLLSTRVLLSSLRRTGTPYPAVVVVPPGLPAVVHDVLTTEGAVVRVLGSVVAPDLSSPVVEQATVHFRNKLLLWSLTDFQRLVLLDHDDLGAWLPIGPCRPLTPLAAPLRAPAARLLRVKAFVGVAWKRVRPPWASGLRAVGWVVPRSSRLPCRGSGGNALPCTYRTPPPPPTPTPRAVTPAPHVCCSVGQHRRAV
jgi:hypothetical protein